MIRLFDIENKKVVPTEHCYTLRFLKDIMDNYPDQYMEIYQYLFYMTCPNPDLNPYFHVPADEKEEQILKDMKAEFSPEDDLIIDGIKRCANLYETETSRAYAGIASMLNRLAKYMETTTIEHGRDGNLTGLINAASKFDQIRQSFKGAYKDLMDEQKTSVRGNKDLSYDDEM